MHLLIIEDDAELASALQAALAGVGYDATHAATVPEAHARLERTRFDLLLLDLELPGGDGLQILRRIREAEDAVPVIIMTGGRVAPGDTVTGLDQGADDYLVKPFEFTELLARIRALMRRARGGEALTFKVADLEVDAAARRARRAGKDLQLTQREFDLLLYLVRHANHLVTREMLAAEVWKEPGRATPLDNVVDVHISHLRRKVDGHAEQKLIHTLRGQGFVLSDRP